MNETDKKNLAVLMGLLDQMNNLIENRKTMPLIELELAMQDVTDQSMEIFAQYDHPLVYELMDAMQKNMDDLREAFDEEALKGLN